MYIKGDEGIMTCSSITGHFFDDSSILPSTFTEYGIDSSKQMCCKLLLIVLSHLNDYKLDPLLRVSLHVLFNLT